MIGKREIVNAEIGTRLKKARLSANLTLTEAGKKIGISGSVLRRYEIGTIKSISIDILKKFADIYDVPTYSLLGWDTPTPTFICTPKEQDLIKKYRILSTEEKETIDDIIEIRYQKRIKKSNIKVNTTP